MKSVIEKGAKADLEEAASYYDEKGPLLSQEFLSEFEEVLEQIELLPRAAPSDLQGIRQASLRRFPFRVVYFIDDNFVRVMAVVHKRRRPGFWKDRL